MVIGQITKLHAGALENIYIPGLSPYGILLVYLLRMSSKSSFEIYKGYIISGKNMMNITEKIIGPIVDIIFTKLIVTAPEATQGTIPHKGYGNRVLQDLFICLIVIDRYSHF